MRYYREKIITIEKSNYMLYFKNMQSNIRAGLYINQIKGYKAFIPSPLPPDPPIQYDEELYSLISQADRALGRLDGATDNLPNPELFIFMYIKKEALHSSQIEGTQGSLSDVLEYEKKLQKPVVNKGDVGEVLNYIQAMNYGIQRLNEFPLSKRLIREIHERLIKNVRGYHLTPGEFRRTQNWIGPEHCTLEEASFIPPPPEEMMDSLTGLEEYIHKKDGKTPALIKVGLVHAQFETIHPFLDGNGRIGRLLITFLLCNERVLSRPALYLSAYFKQYKAEYYKRLQNIRDVGDWEGWLKFFLRGVYEVSLEASKTSRSIVDLRESHRSMIMEGLPSSSAGNAIKLLEYLYSTPSVTVNEAKNILGVSYANANKSVANLESLGILVEKTGKQRNREYMYQSYLSLFKA